MTVLDIALSTNYGKKNLVNMVERDRQEAILDAYKDTIEHITDRKTRIAKIDEFIEKNNLYLLWR